MAIQYTTLDALKGYLGINDNDNDTILERTIARVTAQFDLYLGRNIGNDPEYTGMTDTEIRDRNLDVEQVCLEVCYDLWTDTPASGSESNIKSKQIDTLSQSYFSKAEMSGGNQYDFRSVLDMHKKNIIFDIVND